MRRASSFAWPRLRSRPQVFRPISAEASAGGCFEAAASSSSLGLPFDNPGKITFKSYNNSNAASTSAYSKLWEEQAIELHNGLLGSLTGEGCIVFSRHGQDL